MSQTGIARPEDYFKYLENPQGQKEWKRLLERVVNNETYFFREPHHFEVLSKLLLAAYGERGEFHGAKVRVLSAGCSSGEEPYSLAIELLELAQRLPGFDFEVVGVDISHRVLDLAQRAIFDQRSFRNPLARTRRNAWFEPAGDRRYKLFDKVTDKVEFHSLNLNSNLSSKDVLGVLDVIFFRNVLIYLSPAARIQVCRYLVSSLRESGYLFSGTSETLPSPIEELVSQHVDGVFFWKKERAEKSAPLQQDLPGAPRQSEYFSPTEVPYQAGSRSMQRPDRTATRQSVKAPGKGSALLDRSRSGSDRDRVDIWYAEALKNAREERREEALELLREILEEVPDHLDACRLVAELYLDRADFENALLLSDRMIKKNVALAWPYVLRGRVSYYEGDTAKAQSELKIAIYYQPNYWPAHFHLAEVYKTLGEASLAVHAYRNALRNLEKEDTGKESDVGLTGYSRKDIALTCQMNIHSLVEQADDTV